MAATAVHTSTPITQTKTRKVFRQPRTVAAPKVSVVIVNYCQWEDTARLVQQIRATAEVAEGEVEIMVVDNRSPGHRSIRTLRRMPGVSVSITVERDVKFALGLHAKDAKTAKQLSGLASGLLVGAGVMAAQAAQNNEQLAPLVELVQGVRIAVEGNVVMVRAAITEAMIAKAAKAAGG